MDEVIDGIRSRVGAGNLSKSCRRRGCRVYLEGVSSRRIIVDADLAFPAHGLEGRRCDFVVFLDNDHGIVVAAPLELKSGNVDASEAAEQLQAGAEFVEQFAPAQPALTVCRPILVHGTSIHPKQRKELNRAKITFRGRRLTIKTTRCNRRGNLAQALGQ